MPKLKTHRGAAKRFTKKGDTFSHRQTNRSHLNTKMTAKRKRSLRTKAYIASPEIKRLAFSIH